MPMRGFWCLQSAFGGWEARHCLLKVELVVPVAAASSYGRKSTALVAFVSSVII